MIAVDTSLILIFIALIAIVLVFGFGTIWMNRRRAQSEAQSTQRSVAPSVPPPVGTRPAPPSTRAATPPLTPAAAPDVVEEPAVSDEIQEENTVEEGPSEEEVVPVAAPPSVRERTGRTRSIFAKAFGAIKGRGSIDAATWDELEETLLLADIGIRLTDSLLGSLRNRVKSGEIASPNQLLDALRNDMKEQLSSTDRTLRIDSDTTPNVWLFVGVNGVGKTTTIGKVGTAQVGAGRKVLMAAGDTFRAAAAEQLQTWAERAGAEFVRGSEGGDPASVIYDGIQRAGAIGSDLVLADTAGRLHNKANLMEELGKVRRVADKGQGAVVEVLLVIDATTGQNGLAQAREFAAATSVTGVVLTKLDGSAKGGIVFAIETELGIPVKLVGLGETAVDLVTFDPNEFVDALFD
jgi:fused signal recognition particle receptor